MLKKLFTLFILLVVSTSLFASSIKRDIETLKKQFPGENNLPVIYLKVKPPKLAGETAITTNYDYFSNSIIRDQILFDVTRNTPHLFNMVRPFSTFPAGQRHVVHSFKAEGEWVNQTVSNGAGGWPSLDLGLTGTSLTGTVAFVFHTPNRLAIWDGTTNYTINPFPEADPLDPSIQIVGDKMFMASSGNRAIYRFFKSEDLGQTIVYFDSIANWSPTPIFWKLNGGVEVNMAKSPNEQFIMYFGTNEGGAGASSGHVYAGWPRDSADNVWIISSTNQGVSWTGRTIGWDGDTTLVSGYFSDYAPLFENFGQIDGAVDNFGKVHIVANGYGIRPYVENDTLKSRGSLFPVLYWNSTSNTWRVLTYPGIDTNQAVLTYYPTNAIGQSYPSVSVSGDGQVVFIMWTGPQLKADGTLDTAGNGAATPTTYFWRDLYFTYSVDGGNTFEPVQKFPDMANDVSETYGHAAQHIQKIDAITYRAHIVYLADLTTGVGPFDNVLTANPIVYTTYDIIGTKVDNKPILVNNFELEQNYPNPFNPSTNIRFTIPDKNHVTLKVFDVLGREITTLVNEVKDAGTYNVKFAAQNLPSGMYLYTLTAGNYTATKKMMLVK